MSISSRNNPNYRILNLNAEINNNELDIYFDSPVNNAEILLCSSTDKPISSFGFNIFSGDRIPLNEELTTFLNNVTSLTIRFHYNTATITVETTKGFVLNPTFIYNDNNTLMNLPRNPVFYLNNRVLVNGQSSYDLNLDVIDAFVNNTITYTTSGLLSSRNNPNYRILNLKAEIINNELNIYFNSFVNNVELILCAKDSYSNPSNPTKQLGFNIFSGEYTTPNTELDTFLANVNNLAIHFHYDNATVTVYTFKAETYHCYIPPIVPTFLYNDNNTLMYIGRNPIFYIDNMLLVNNQSNYELNLDVIDAFLNNNITYTTNTYSDTSVTSFTINGITINDDSIVNLSA